MPYTCLHGCTGYMESRVNEQLKGMIMLDLDKFKAKMEKAQDDSAKLHKKPTFVFLSIKFEE